MKSGVCRGLPVIYATCWQAANCRVSSSTWSYRLCREEGDTLISVDFRLEQHKCVRLSLLSFILPYRSSLLSRLCVCWPLSTNQLELQLQRPMAPVSLHQWEVSQAGLPGPRPGPGPRPRAWPAAHQRGAVCERGRVQPAWHTPCTARMQGRWDYHRCVCVHNGQLFTCYCNKTRFWFSLY